MVPSMGRRLLPLNLPCPETRIPLPGIHAVTIHSRERLASSIASRCKKQRESPIFATIAALFPQKKKLFPRQDVYAGHIFGKISYISKVHKCTIH